MDGGSPPILGTEFYFPPYGAGAFSNGDVYLIHDIKETDTLEFGTLFPLGSPVGSPILGSPYSWSFYGSPETPLTAGNTITIKSTTPSVFTYGREVTIRNASESTINDNYHIYSVVDLGGSPNLLRLTVLEPVYTDTTNDGELVFTPDGWSGGSYCGDVPPEYNQNHFLEKFETSWLFGVGGSPSIFDVQYVPAFQHFILSADSLVNTITVQGDVRSILSDFIGSPEGLTGSPQVGSPAGVAALIQHGVTSFGSPFFGSPKGSAGSPYNNLNSNNGKVIIYDITYNYETNRSTLTLDSVNVSTPTGWIVSRLQPGSPQVAG